jgi:plasmid stabilization system protein ParE
VKVIITKSAETDLENIAEYIAQDSPKRAVTFVREVVDAAMRLADFPTAYSLIPNYESRGLRRRPYGNYVIFYVIRSEWIAIERVLNAAQDVEAELFPDDK